MLRVFFIFVGILLLVYCLYAAYFYRIQRWAIFPRHLMPPVQTTIADFPDWQQRWIEVPGARVESWFSPPDVSPNPGVAPLFILAHGNGDVMDEWPPRVQQLQRLGYGVLLVEYPGYGRSTGEPGQEEITASFMDAYDWALTQPGIDPQRVILFGFSVGGGAIGTLAAQRPSAALILKSTFTSVRDQASRFFLPGFLARDPFDNVTVVQHYTNPLLLIHGTRDTTIAHQNSVTLHRASNDGKLLLLPCGHSDCIDDWDSFWLTVIDFLVERGVVEREEQ